MKRKLAVLYQASSISISSTSYSAHVPFSKPIECTFQPLLLDDVRYTHLSTTYGECSAMGGVSILQFPNPASVAKG